MLTRIRERTVVKENGMIEIPATDLAVGTEVEVIVLVEEEEMNTTEYLLSNEANRQHLEAALEESEHPENFIQFDVDELKNLWKK